MRTNGKKLMNLSQVLNFYLGNTIRCRNRWMTFLSLLNKKMMLSMILIKNMSTFTRLNRTKMEVRESMSSLQVQRRGRRPLQNIGQLLKVVSKKKIPPGLSERVGSRRITRKMRTNRRDRMTKISRNQR